LRPQHPPDDKKLTIRQINQQVHKRPRTLICLVLYCVLFAGTGIQANAQIMVNATGKPASLVICGTDGTFTLQIANTTGVTMTGATLALDLPPGARYSAGSAVGATELNISNLNQPTFNLPDILNNTAHTVSFNAGLVCGYTNTENFIYTVTYNNSDYTGYDTPLQNFYYPEPVITNITNASAVIPVNTTVTRDITIQQQGMNSGMDTLWLLDQHTSDIQVISTNIGTLHPYIGPGPLRVDTIILTGSDFPGGNGIFDAGESIIVSETVKLVGCTNGQSTLKASWGCFGQICNYYSAFPTVSPAAGTTSIAMAYTNNNLGWGFIDNHGWVEFTLTNNGTGAGTAFDLVALAGFSSGGSTYYPNSNWINKIDSFSVNGIKVPANYNYAAGALNGQYAFYTRFPYTTDPDGSAIGIEDADGDGFFDDLPIGKTVKIKAHCYYSWTQAQSTIATRNTCGYGWTNSAYQSFRYGYDYKNQCLVQFGVNWIPNGNLLLFQTYDTRTSKHTMPSDLFDGISVWMEHEVVTSTAVTVDGCPNDSVIYKLTLPKGIVIGTGTATFKGVSMGTPMVSGDTVFYFLSRSRILSGGLFRVPLVLDCDLNPSSTGYVRAELKFWCDHTAFPDRFFTYWCSNSPTFWLQCPPPGCKDPSISLFTVKRTTLGWTNNQLTAKVNPSSPGLRLDNAMSRDTIRIEAAGRLNGAVDSLFFRLKHDAPGGAWGNQLFFEPLSDTLYFFDQETSVWYTCPNLSPLVTNGTTSSLTTYFGNLTTPGNCLNGISFTAGDSIRYIVYGKVKNMAQSEWRTVPLFRGAFFNIEGNKENSCNSRGTTFNILGSNFPAIVSTYYQQIVLQGCTSFLYEGMFYRSLESCGGDVAFPNEIRPLCVADTIIFTLPEGFVYQTGSSFHTYILDNGSSSNEAIADPLIDISAAGTKLIFIRTPSWKYSDYYDCSTDYDRIIFNATPSCKATGDYSWLMDARGRYQFMANGEGVRCTSTGSKSISYTPPLMTMTRLITTAEGREDTVMWKIRLCNTRSFTASNNWTGFESTSGGIRITDITDITNPAAPVNIPVTSYGPGKTWAAMGSYSANLCKIYRVRAVYSSCSYDSIRVRHGYNCANTPLNPELGYPPSGYLCNENITYLYLDPKDVSLNLTINSPANTVNLCDTLDYEILVTNSQPATAYNLKLSVLLPPGTAIMNGQSQFKYPYTTGAYSIISDPVNIPAGSNKWVYNISSDPDATERLKGVDSLPKNGYKLRFRLLADCNFISGTQLKIIASAANACGDEKTRTSFTQPILITGLPSNVNLYVLNTTTAPGFSTCNVNTLVKVKVINLGPGSVSSIEKLSVTIDDAFDYVNSSLTGIHNGPSGLASNSVTGGIRYIYFSIQPNLNVNDSIVFTFLLHDIDPGSLVCDTIPMETSTLLVGKVFCNLVAGDSCIIQSITATITTERPVLKDQVSFGHYTATSIPNGTTGETINVHYKIRNTGNDTLRSSDLAVVFIHDANGNGLADETSVDSLYGQTVPVANLPPGDSITATAIFIAPADKVCNLLAAMRIGENICTCNDAVLKVSGIRLINAGPDVQVCQGTDVQIGTSGISGYSYIWVPSSFLNSGTVSNPVFNYNSILTNPITLSYAIITTRPGSCISRDTVLVTVTPQTTAFAGNDDTICQGMPYTVSDAQAQYQSSVHWQSSGTGTFNDPALLNPVYSPSIADVLAGNVFLTLTASGGCGVAADVMKLTLIHAASSFAGKDTSICFPWIYSLTDAAASFYSMIRWKTTGDGNFNDTLLLHPIYTPGPSDISNGFVKLVLTATGNPPCLTVTDTVRLVYNAVPVVTNSPAALVICSGTTTSIVLTGSLPGTTFSWSCIAGSPDLSGYSPGTGNIISQTLINGGFAPGTVTYSIIPVANGCPGPVFDFVVTVNPKPDVSNNPLSSQICSGSSTNVVLTSNVTGTDFTWTATGSSPNITGYGPGSGTWINQVLVNLGLNPEFVTYHIIPAANGCQGDPTDYVVSIAQVPDVYFQPPGQTICSGQATGINILSHVTGTTFTWTVSGSPFISGFSPGAGPLISQTLINSDILPHTVTYVVYPAAFGCPPGIPGSTIVTVNPRPVITNMVTDDSICSGTQTDIPIYSTVTGSSFTWTASGSSGNVSGYSNGGGTVIMQLLSNTGFTDETVTYKVVPQASGCPGDTVAFHVTVHPVPDLFFTPPFQTICSGKTTSITNNSHVAGSTYSWNASGSSFLVSGFFPGSGNLITQTIVNSGYNVETVTYHVSASANGCPGFSGDVVITVDPAPMVNYTACHDVITSTNAQPIHLKGGLPLGGVYAGAGVDSVTGVFYPGTAGPGTHQIIYKYTNFKTCTSYDTISIAIYQSTFLNCGVFFTDIRDNHVYPTVQIGSQCWLASNLNFGQQITSSTTQRDNCQVEKYCYNDDPGKCPTYGGYYQWDELMQYREDQGVQGLCPPGWRIPTESDWNTLFSVYINNGFAGSPLKYSGYSGFNAWLGGTKVFNWTWNFLDLATLFWSSSRYSTTKAWAHGMNDYDPSVSYYPSSKSNALSVRCIKD
jgi:uncharacterized protein (TIGR02145 family)/uncharacterized repeat protein (TIGR01451 family)